MKSVELKIKKLNPKAKVPEYKTQGAAGCDLCALLDEEVVLKPLERKLVPTGLSIELPIGYEAQIRPRSGLSLKHGITLINAIGTIDSDYRGEILVPLVNLSNEPYCIKPYERICQMVINKVEMPKIVVVEQLNETARSAGGFGSTGTH